MDGMTKASAIARHEGVIVAEFPRHCAVDLGEWRWEQLRAQLTPTLNLLAGQPVYWRQDESGWFAVVRHPAALAVAA